MQYCLLYPCVDPLSSTRYSLHPVVAITPFAHILVMLREDARRYAFCSDLHTLRDEFPAFLRVRLLAFSYYAERRLVDGGQLRLFAGVLGRFLYGRFDLF